MKKNESVKKVIKKNLFDLVSLTAQDAKKIAIEACVIETQWALERIKEHSENGKTSMKFQNLKDGTVAFLEANNFHVHFHDDSLLHEVIW